MTMRVLDMKCEKCDGTGKVDGNPIWIMGNHWKDTKVWCPDCEGEGVIPADDEYTPNTDAEVQP